MLTILAPVSTQRHHDSASATVNNPKYRPNEASYKANQVCALFDISKATLFRWEREGVISQPARDWRNWRLYTRKNVDEIEKVIRVRKAVA
ncbi:MAG: MerR family transcriptional regulator [Nitrospira sp. LK70]|nr:MerR family transcriptional regulator [Nitrospira sp. LK70]